MERRTKKEEKNSYLQSSKTDTIGKTYLKSKNREQGITLIALVVTIVVLLILAGITIQLVLADGGIFSQASRAKEQTEIATLRERIDNVRISYITNKVGDSSLKIDDLWDRLIGADIIERKEDVGGPVLDNGKNVYTVNTKDGYTVEIIVDETGLPEIGNIVKGTLPPVIRDYKVTSIELEKTTAEVGEGESIVLKVARVLPEDAENKEVTWSSDTPAIATVDENGKVTGVAEGNCNIIATAKDGSGVTATCSLTVVEKESDWGYLNRVAIAIAQDATITANSPKATGKTSENEDYDIEIGNDAKSIFKVKYTPDLTKPNETTILKVRVLGFKHDTLAENTSYGNVGSPAAISFEFIEFLGGSHQMNTSDDNSLGWKGCTMRSYLNGSSNTTKGGIVTGLSNKDYIKKVTKPYLLGSSATVASTDCSDWLWLLSCSEIWANGIGSGANYGYAKAKEGERYKFYSVKNPDGSSEDANTNLQKGPKGGSTNLWWLRSPTFHSSNAAVCVVSHVGSSSYTDAVLRTNVAPGFSI